MQETMFVNLISLRKFKEVVKRKWDYDELETSVLQKFLENSQQMQLSIIYIENEPTEDEPEPEKTKHNGLVLTDKLDQVNDVDMKFLEIELNVYELKDFGAKVEKRRIGLEKEMPPLVQEQRKERSTFNLINIALL